MLDEKAIDRLLQLLEEEPTSVYLFMDEQGQELDSGFFATDEQALAHARTLPCRVVNVLRYVATADHDEEVYGLY